MKRIDTKQICLDVSNQLGIPVKDVEEMYDLFFERIKFYIQLPIMPKIIIDQFFYFEKNLESIFKRLDAIKNALVMGDVTQEYHDMVINHFKNALNNTKNLDKHEGKYRRKMEKYRTRYR